MARVADHLSVLDLEQRFSGCSDPVEARHVQATWLLAQGHTVGATSKVTVFGPRWIEQLLERYNASGPDALANGRRRNGLKPGALRNGAPFKNWALPPSFERVRSKLAGTDDGDRQMVGLLTAAMDDGLEALEAACLEALEASVHSADVIINILARRREPALIITIDTPEALRLQHEPAADCARYDSLRSIT